MAAYAPTEIIELLRQESGELPWRPHGDPMTELVLTILSQNTSDANSGRAFARLRLRYPTWEALLGADPREIEGAIQVGGLARIKAPRIKAVLEEVWRRLGSFDLSFLKEMPLAEANSWLRSLPGVGPNTSVFRLTVALAMSPPPVETRV